MTIFLHFEKIFLIAQELFLAWAMGELIVFHGQKDRVSDWLEVPSSLKEVFSLETCQRFLIVGLIKEGLFTVEELPRNPFWEIYRGHEAYAFLLEFVCGLKSALVGETEVFSQFRKAYEAQKDKLLELRRYFEWLIRDGKEIRHLYLQNMGNGGYGSLVRRVLQNRYRNQNIKGDVFLLGAGQLAFSISPYLADFAWEHGGKLFIYNRGIERLKNLEMYLNKLKKTNIEAVTELKRNFYLKSSLIVVYAKPYEENLAQEIEKTFLENTEINRFFLRLSGEEKEGAYKLIPKEMTMSLIELLKQKNEKEKEREKKIYFAKKYCAHKALLRFFGHYTHSWEDLSFFQLAT